MATMNSPPSKVILEGRGPITLRQSDYVATGGEASIYRANATSIKLYTDTDKMIRDRMPDKMKLLSNIRHEYIMAPQGLVLDQKNNPIGFYMPFVDAEHLARVFTNDFRQRSNFGDEEAKKLVHRMKETVQVAHDHKALMVDPNELNWLVVVKGKGGPEPRVIDVDSWAVGSWPPKVIMPSIRDWHSKNFSVLTDWFSWGIVTFQILSGIHPYKGTLAGYQRGELEKRMKDNASVFTKGVQLNHAVRDFKTIPGPLLEWYKAVFQQGERLIPPSPYDIGLAAAASAQVLHITITATGALVFEKLFEETNDAVIRVWPSGVCLLKSGKLVDLGRKRAIGKIQSKDGEVVKVQGGWLIADWVAGKLSYSFVNETSLQEDQLSLQLNTNKLFRYAERLFVTTDRGLTEIVFTNLGKPLISPGQTWGVMVNATKWFGGIGVQDAIGAMFLVLPFGDKSSTQMRVRELDGLQTVSAKAGHRFATLVALDKQGRYQKMDFAFGHDYKTCRITQCEVDTPELNIAILPKGVCAGIIDDGELIISVPTSGKINKVADKNIATDMELSNWEDKVVYIQNGAAWSIRMK